GVKRVSTINTIRMVILILILLCFIIVFSCAITGIPAFLCAESLRGYEPPNQVLSRRLADKGFMDIS
ncbi:MAG TPA: hypothetical protein VF352_02755, partial [Anaerolineales bacterium]